MKANVRTLDGAISREITLPRVFGEEYRPDLIRKAVMALQSTRRQPHGTHPYAGIRSSAVGWGSGRGAVSCSPNQERFTCGKSTTGERRP